MRVALAVFVAWSCVTGCGDDAGDPLAQWLVTVSTDAQVPAFGAILMIDVLDANGPSERRVFDVAAPSAWPVSFGIRPGEVESPRIRARLFRADQAGVRGEPNSAAVIDLTARLPPLREPRGIVPVQLPMPMACLGVEPDLAAAMSCEVATGNPAAERVLTDSGELDTGSWAPGKPRPCRAAVPEGMVCVPGGAFLLGVSSPANDPYAELAIPVRTVQVSPFALDLDELTIGRARELIRSGALPSPDIVQDASIDCRYPGEVVSSRDSEPLNCVGRETAARICELLGKRLPTESEWEYAAGNLGEKTIYPWGNDPDICAHSVVARSVDSGEGFCIIGTRVQRPVSGGNPKDVTALGLRNMGGNVAEWTSDSGAALNSACWSGDARVLVDPRCTAERAPLGSVEMARGGAWDSPPNDARVSRRHVGTRVRPQSVGLRCAASAGD